MSEKIKDIKENNDINEIIQGYREFKNKYFGSDTSLYKKLTEYGQKPKALVIACSDSRVHPAILINSKPGELFVVRNVANLVPPYQKANQYPAVGASLEFGVCVLNVKHVILLGHSQCGGIANLIESKNKSNETNNTPTYKLVENWTKIAAPALDIITRKHADETLEEKINLCGKYSLINSLNNLRSFPFINEKEQNNELYLHVWNFELETGLITSYDEKIEKFIKFDGEL